MIVSFLHKGLEQFFTEGKTKGVQQEHIKRLRIRLLFLDALEKLEDFKEFPNFKFHKLEGDLKERYSISVNGNWRLTFRWDEENKNVEVLDYVDYH